jgi:poly(A) polymerase
MPPTPEILATDIVRKLQSAGHIAYFAGGCVRDRLMNRTPKDFDVATSAHPDQVLALFPHSQLVGVAFGVVIVRQFKIQVEVATFRSEGAYSDGRRPDSISFTTPQIDAQRRDFTCNGLFFDPLANTLHDYVGGQSDIAAKTLRAIGEPAHRFAEDHLRMMRAVRFAAKLNFNIDPATFKAIQDHVAEIQKISKERIGEELRLMLEHPERASAAKMLAESGLLSKIWPVAPCVLPKSWNTLSALRDQVSRTLGLAAMYIDFVLATDTRSKETWDWPRIAELLQKQFVLSNQEAAEFEWINDAAEILIPTTLLDEYFGRDFTKAHFKRLMADARWPNALKLCEAMLRDSGQITKLHNRAAQMQSEGIAPAPFVTGSDLISLGASPGPQFKRWLDQLYDRQLELEFPTRDAALAAARKLISG